MKCTRKSRQHLPVYNDPIGNVEVVMGSCVLFLLKPYANYVTQKEEFLSIIIIRHNSKIAYHAAQSSEQEQYNTHNVHRDGKCYQQFNKKLAHNIDIKMVQA